MKVWTRSEVGGGRPVYWMTREYSPDWWGKLQTIDGKWKFSCGLRGDSSMVSKSSQGHKNLDNAKARAKAFLQIAQNTYNANRIFIGELNGKTL